MNIEPYEAGVALMGPDTPPVHDVLELMRHLATVYKRFGNTAVRHDIRWGASALWMRDEQKQRIEALESELARYRVVEVALLIGNKDVEEQDRAKLIERLIGMLNEREDFKGRLGT